MIVLPVVGCTTPAQKCPRSGNDAVDGGINYCGVYVVLGLKYSLCMMKFIASWVMMAGM